MVGVFEDQVKESSTYGVLVLLAYSLRDFLLPMFLIYLVDYPLIQIAAILLFHLAIIIAIICTLPFEDFFENLAELFNNTMMILITLIYFALYFLSPILNMK